MVDENIAPMPTFVQNEYVTEHQKTGDTNFAQDAHPIDDRTLEKLDAADTYIHTLHHPLAAVQSIATREIIGCGREEVRHVEQDGDLHYYRATSHTYYWLMTKFRKRYEREYIEIEDLNNVMEAHTRQLLSDVHGYAGDFGNQSISDSAGEQSEPDFGGETAVEGRHFDPTLCNAQNDDHSIRNEMPDDAHYAFTDARGLVVREGTHE